MKYTSVSSTMGINFIQLFSNVGYFEIKNLDSIFFSFVLDRQIANIN